MGQLAAQCAFLRGASRVIIIDSVQFRLDRAKEVRVCLLVRSIVRFLVG